MAKLSTSLTRIVVGVVVLAIVATGAYFVFFDSSPTKTVTAQFDEATGIYVQTPVRILGVNVGEVTSVTPGPSYVSVKMTYDAKYRILAKGATAVEVANSLVSDRYIQLGTLISKSDKRAALGNNATIDDEHTSGPAELDQIYEQLDRLSVALGPQGANAGGQSKGALSTLLKVSAANLKGNGAALGQSIGNLAAAAKTLSDHKGGLFGTVRNLQKFTSTLKASDTQVRLFNSQLAEVAGDLASERGDLGSALNLLGLALNDVSAFVKNNASKFHSSIQGLAKITTILAQQKASLDETLSIAPVALANVVHLYNPAQGSLGTRSNLVSLTNIDLQKTAKETLCGLLGLATAVPGVGGLLKTVCGTTSSSSKTSSAKSGSSSTSAKSSSSAHATKVSDGSTAALQSELSTSDGYLVDTMLNGGIPPGMLIGSGS